KLSSNGCPNYATPNNNNVTDREFVDLHSIFLVFTLISIRLTLWFTALGPSGLPARPPLPPSEEALTLAPRQQLKYTKISMHAIFAVLYKVATCRLSWPLWVLRLRGTAALQANNGYRSLDQDLEGVRSPGAALIDESFVWSGQACVDCCGLYRVPRLR